MDAQPESGTSVPDFVVCPECWAPLNSSSPERLFCDRGHAFGTHGTSVDFLDARPVTSYFAESCAHVELSGMHKRVDNYILPWLADQGSLEELRVLEDGCGVGGTVDYLVELGVDAYGIDPGNRVKWWSDLAAGDRLYRADGTKLPFYADTFDVVLSNGVIEHVGEPRGRRNQHPFQRAYIQEMLRVLKPGGVALIAAPNGAFPIDFWHRAHRPVEMPLRFHLPWEAWMPNSFEIRRWAQGAHASAEVRFLPPANYLAFDNVSSTGTAGPSGRSWRASSRWWAGIRGLPPRR